MYLNKLLEEIEYETARNGSRQIIQCDELTLTGDEFRNLTTQWLNEFKEMGLLPNSKVIVCIEDMTEFLVIWMALWKLNCTPIPLEMKLKENELKQAINASYAEVLLTEKEKNHFRENRMECQKSVCNPKINYIFTEYYGKSDRSERASLYFYTSGTTGVPKCVMFDHEAMYYNIADLADELALTEEDIIFTPLSPVLPAVLTTAVLPALLRGSKLVLTKKQLPRTIAKKVYESNATIFFAVPYIYELLINSLQEDLKKLFNNLRINLSSSAYLSKNLMKQFSSYSNKYIRSIYCSSEAGAISYNGSDKEEAIYSTVGKPFRNTNIRIAAEDDMDVEIGEIYVTGTHLSFGYFNQEKLQKNVYTEYGVKTGDLGALDEEGNITLLGRVQDTINVGGYLIVPTEIEEIILEMRDVKEVVVYGTNDENFKQIVSAKVVTNQPDITVAQIIDYCSQRLSHYKIPRIIEFVSELPKSRYGKKIRLFQESSE